jgi:GT2 family glycosyltransferase
MEFLLTPGPVAPGWMLVKGRLNRRGRNLRATIRIHRSDGSPDEFPLPVLFDGRIHELIELPRDAGNVFWRPPEVGHYDPSQLTIAPIGWIGRTARMLVRVLRTFARLSKEEREECGLVLPAALLDLPRAYRTCTGLLVRSRGHPYSEWTARFDTLSQRDRRLIRDHIERFASHPRFRIVVAAEGATPQAVAATLASMHEQLYGNFDCAVLNFTAGLPGRGSSDIGLAVQAIAPNDVPDWLERLNAELADAPDGMWVMLLRAGDRLPPHSLYWFAWEIQNRPGAALLYSDDDLVDGNGRRSDPRFKPDWSPSHLRALNYVGAAAVLRGRDVAAAGGIAAACCRNGNYDLLLRVGDADGAQVAHIPAILLHRSAEAREGGAPDDPQWGEDVLRAHLARKGVAAEIAPAGARVRRLRYRLPATPPLVSIIVPTRDAATLLRDCIDGVLQKTSYPSFEIIVVDNRSSDPSALAYLGQIAASHPRARVLQYKRRFNYSAINNFAARHARGELLCLLNNDIQVISPDWLEEMAGHLLQPGIGAVGAKLYYPDERVQHGGVTVGPGGCANHLHVGIGRQEAGYCDRATIAQELSAVTGACLLTWKDVYWRLGGLNEKKLTVGFNDIDYCLRLQEAGYRVIYTPHAELYHHESATRGSDAPLHRRLRARGEVDYMRRRWRERMRHDPYYNPNMSYRRPDFALGESARVKKPWRDGA